MNQVVTKLKAMIISENDQTNDGKSNLQSNKQPDSNNTRSSINDEVLQIFLKNLFKKKIESKTSSNNDH